MDHDSPEPNPPTNATPEATFHTNLPTHTGDSPARRDGWTPFSRRLFLEVLAESGRVTRACDYAGLTRQSAYALRARDPLFAAGWDAACELARSPLADALYEQAIDGVTDTIKRGGEVVAERHRFDSRLSIAVLHRLDKRCDRAAEQGARHLRLMRHWDEWLGLVGNGDEHEARALFQTGLTKTARDRQSRQLAESAIPTEPDPADRCWKDANGTWMTDFPPPPDFTDYENGAWGDEDYERECSDEEAELLDASQTEALSAPRAEDEALRDAYFGGVRDETADPTRQPGLEPGPACSSASEEKSESCATDNTRHPGLEPGPAFASPTEEESESCATDNSRHPGLEPGPAFTSAQNEEGGCPIESGMTAIDGRPGPHPLTAAAAEQTRNPPPDHATSGSRDG